MPNAMRAADDYMHTYAQDKRGILDNDTEAQQRQQGLHGQQSPANWMGHAMTEDTARCTALPRKTHNCKFRNEDNSIKYRICSSTPDK